jgi:hypothetical protein
MRVDPYLMKCRGLTTRIRGDSSATGIKLRGPEGAQRLRATSDSMSELDTALFSAHTPESVAPDLIGYVHLPGRPHQCNRRLASCLDVSLRSKASTNSPVRAWSVSPSHDSPSVGLHGAGGVARSGFGSAHRELCLAASSSIRAIGVVLEPCSVRAALSASPGLGIALAAQRRGRLASRIEASGSHPSTGRNERQQLTVLVLRWRSAARTADRSRWRSRLGITALRQPETTSAALALLLAMTPAILPRLGSTPAARTNGPTTSSASERRRTFGPLGCSPRPLQLHAPRLALSLAPGTLGPLQPEPAPTVRTLAEQRAAVCASPAARHP